MLTQTQPGLSGHVFSGEQGTPVHGSPSPQKQAGLPSARTQQKHRPPGQQSIFTLHGVFGSQGHVS
ncbi:MAG: hypothetical protein ACRDHO_14845 [Actinomycetota bacterium]